MYRWLEIVWQLQCRLSHRALVSAKPTLHNRDVVLERSKDGFKAFGVMMAVLWGENTEQPKN